MEEIEKKIQEIESGKILFEIDKENNFFEWYNVIFRVADLIDDRYPVKGMPIYKPYGFRLVLNILRELEKELEKDGFEPAWFPVLIPKEIFRKEEEHFREFSKEVFWVKKGLEEGAEYVLRPTSETEMYYMFSFWVQSYRDLPIKIYQTGTVYRAETKQTKAWIRGRELYWNEAHTAHRTKEEAEEMILKAMKIYEKIFWEICSVPIIWTKRPIWDKFAGADYTIAAETILMDGKFLQIGTIHMLGQRFSRVYDIKFQDEDGEWKYVWQTSFGISMRFAAAVVCYHGDNKGLILPPKVAPIQVIIVPIIYKGKEEAVLEKARKIYERLKEKFRVKIDDRKDRTPGWKYYYWEMKGVPVRIEIGPKDVEKGGVTLVRRDTREKVFVKDEEIEEKILELFEKIDKELKRRAKEYFEKKIVVCETMEELKKAIEERKVAKVPFCSIEEDGAECGKKLKEELQVDVRGPRFPEPEGAEGKKCIVCGRPAKYWVYVGKSY